MTHANAAIARTAPLATRSILSQDAIRDLAGGFTALLADALALYLKTKNFHWHMSGPRFRDYHLELDQQASQILAIIDPLAERARKIGGTTLRSLGHAARLQRLLDNDADFVTPQDMLAELREDNLQFAAALHGLHHLAGEHHDFASAGLIETFLDEAERRAWFLFEMTRTDRS